MILPLQFTDLLDNFEQVILLWVFVALHGKDVCGRRNFPNGPMVRTIHLFDIKRGLVL